MNDSSRGLVLFDVPNQREQSSSLRFVASMRFGARALAFASSVVALQIVTTTLCLRAWFSGSKPTFPRPGQDVSEAPTDSDAVSAGRLDDAAVAAWVSRPQAPASSKPYDHKGVCHAVSFQDLDGNDFKDFFSATAQACCQACIDWPTCRGWTFARVQAAGASNCWLKSGETRWKSGSAGPDEGLEMFCSNEATGCDKSFDAEQNIMSGITGRRSVPDDAQVVARPSPPRGWDKRASIWVLVPSVPRREGTNYLLDTIPSLLSELDHRIRPPFKHGCVGGIGAPDSLQAGLAVDIFLFNHGRPRSSHAAFLDYERSANVSRDKGINCVSFVANHEAVMDPFPELPGEGSEGYKWNPEPNARQQTADVVSMLRHVEKIASQRKQQLPDYVMLWEDDCLAFEGLWDELDSRLRMLRTVHPTMASMQVGMGGSGLVLATVYIAHLAEYLLKRSTESAVDVLINAYMQQYSRPHFLSRQALAHHVGSVSTFDGREHLEYGALIALAFLL